jgi:mevalonate kinase
MQDCENSEFKNSILNEYTPLNNSCIQSLMDADIEKFTNELEALSQFQATNFKRMIPSSIHEDWMYGLSSGKYILKLCGAGGGGFVLGFTHHYKEVKERFLERGMQVVPVWQVVAK